MEQRKKKPAGSNRLAVLGGVTVTTQLDYITRTKRYRCPVHHGKNLSVSVGYVDGRAWAKCWSQGCASADILAALGITNAQSIPWTPPPPPRPRPTFNVETLPPISPFAASEYLKGILTPAGSSIAYQRDDGQRGHHWRSDTKRRNPGVIGDGWQLRRFDPIDPRRRRCYLPGRRRERRRDPGGRWPDCFHRAEGSPELTLGRLHGVSGPGQGNRSPGVPLR